MSLSADVATLLVKVNVEGNASSEASKISSSFRSLGASGGIASGAMNVLERGAGGVGSAFTHLKGTIGGIVSGPLGFLGLGAAVLSVGGALKSGIDTANSMSIAIEKLTGVTGLSAESASGLIAVFGKFGIQSAQLSQIAGFEEKTIGKLNETMGKGKDPVSKLTALQDLYGVKLTNSKGQALDFATVLNHVSDYYNSNATAGQKAALAATLFGRGFATMIPVLKLGSAGIAEAEQAAAKLGLTLTESNVVDLKNYQETMRELGDAVGGLQLQLSLALVPAIKDVATAATTFIAGNRAGIVSFFKDLIADARTAAGFITGTIIPDLQSLAGAAAGFWNSIPSQLRDILIKGFVADRAMKFLFGFDPVTTIGSIIGKQLISTLMGGIGGVVAQTLGSKAIPQDVFVVNMVPGGLGGIGGAAGGAEAAAGGGGAGILETIGGAGWMAALAPLAVAAIVPLALNALINGDPAKTGANDLAARQTIAAGRGLNPANVPTDITGRRSAAPGAGPDYGAIVGAIKSTGLTAQQTALAMGAKIAASAKTFEIAAAISHLSSLTVAQMNTLSGSLQLQRVAIIHGGTMTYTELLHQSAVAHADHISNQAHIDGITVAAEKIKMAALATAANVALTTAAVKASAGIIGTMIGGRLDELPSGPATPMPPAGLSAHQLHLLHVSVTTSPTSAAKVTTTAKAVGAKKVGVN